MSAPRSPALRDHYETLRAWATAQRGRDRGARPAGLALVLRRGLPAWLAAWATWLPAQTGTDELPGRLAPLPQVVSAPLPLISILATMVEQSQREEQR